MAAEPTPTDVARCADLTPQTVRRWGREGVLSLANEAWSPAAVAHARRLMARPFREVR